MEGYIGRGFRRGRAGLDVCSVDWSRRKEAREEVERVRALPLKLRQRGSKVSCCIILDFLITIRFVKGKYH